MRRPLVLIALLLAFLTLVPGAHAAAPKLKSCSSKGVMAGPFFTERLRARVVSCRSARKFVRKWGNTQDCVSPRGGPSDDVCRVGRYRCVTTTLGYELSKATCKRKGTRRAVGFRFGS